MTFFAIGVMTGTSCDGADLAVLCLKKTKGRWTEKLVYTLSKSYPTALRAKLREAQKDKLPMSAVAEVQKEYSEWIGALCKGVLTKRKIPTKLAVIGVHGQTVWHKPPAKNKRGYTVQLVDPAIVAFITGVTVTSQFRQPDMARFGQGAPLVPYYHWLRASSELKAQVPLVMINIGGISNLTFVPASKGGILAFDCGPGNAMIDLATEAYTKGRWLFDKNGAIGASAEPKIDWVKVRKITNESYYKAKPPKSTGRELFNEKYLKKIPGTGDIRVANATALTASALAKAMKDFLPFKKIKAIYVCGGGAKNPFLLKLVQKEFRQHTGLATRVLALPPNVAPPQYIEAMAFARLGFESLLAGSASLSTVTGASSENFGAGIFPGPNFSALLNALYK